jgi:hypothetical protein
MLFRMVNDRKKGTYSISNDRWFLSIKGIVNDKYKFWFKEKVLIINGFPKKGGNLFLKIHWEIFISNVSY